MAEELSRGNEVYYRILLGDDFKFHIVTMQYFDECDYDQNKFLNNDHYETEKDAEIFLQKEYTKSKLFINFFYNTFGY